MANKRLSNILALKAEEAAERDVRQQPHVMDQPLIGYPEPLGPAAFYGLAGRVVQTLSPFTEADPAGLLAQLLIVVGNITDYDIYFTVEATPHAGNLFVALVGPTGKGRKGTSLRRILDLFERVDRPSVRHWREHRLWRGGGLATGEGLIAQVRDGRLDPRIIAQMHGQHTEGDADDKPVPPDRNRPEDTNELRKREDGRILAVESELAGVFKKMNREGNTLGAVQRQAWDGRWLAAMPRADAARASQAHVSLIGHATKDAVQRFVTEDEINSGTANRWLWFVVRRVHELPDGGAPPDHILNPLVMELANWVKWLESLHPPVVVKWAEDDGTHDAWRQVYHDLSANRPGLLGVVTSREEAQCVRLALIYALLDQSLVICRPHLEAALEVLRYARDTCRWIWGEGFSPAAQEILDLLKKEGALTRTAINDHFSGHLNAHAITRALQELLDQEQIRTEKDDTPGRKGRRPEWIRVVDGGTP